MFPTVTLIAYVADYSHESFRRHEESSFSHALYKYLSCTHFARHSGSAGHHTHKVIHSLQGIREPSAKGPSIEENSIYRYSKEFLCKIDSLKVIRKTKPAITVSADILTKIQKSWI